jgi:hypothetical protein
MYDIYDENYILKEIKDIGYLLEKERKKELIITIYEA